MSDQLSRRQARQQAIEVIYEAQICDQVATKVLAELPVEADAFVKQLVEVVANNKEKSLALITDASDGWELKRMPVMDVVVMQVGIAELIIGETPQGVILSEAVELAAEYSTESSAKFVNGVLSAIAESSEFTG